MVTDENDRSLFKRLDRESLNTILLLKHNSDEVLHIELTNGYQDMDDIDDDECSISLKPLVVTNLNPTMLRRLGYIIGQNTMLRSLKLSFRNLDITWLSHGLQCNRSITWFRLRNESRRAELPGIPFVSCLTSFWRNNPSLKRQIIDRCFIGSDGLDILTNALLSRHYAGTLRYLDLSNNFFFFDVDTIGFSGLVGALAKYKRLRRLLLSHNAIGNKGCTPLVELLDNKNCILKELHLNRNWMGLDSLAVLAEPLAKNNTLEYLNINDNHLDYYNKSNEACWKGWRQMLKLVCNRSSIDNIKKSNHILCNLGMSSPYHILNAVIKLNANPNKDLVIRQKLIWAHADSRLNIGESSIPTGALPEVIAWFVDDDPNRENGHIIQYHDPPLPYETIRVIRLDSIYRIARCRSDLFTHGATHICSDCRRYAGNVKDLQNRNNALQEKIDELHNDIERLQEEIDRLRAT